MLTRNWSGQVKLIDEQCAQVFEARHAKLEIERRRADRERRGLLEARNAAAKRSDETGKEETPGAKRRRKQLKPLLPNKDMEYVRQLFQIVSPLFVQEELQQSANDRGEGTRATRAEQDPTFGWNWGTEWLNLERALLHLLFANNQYQRVIEAIRTMKLSSVPCHLFRELEEIWYECFYQVTDHRRPVNEFTPVNRYRIRQKNPCPTWTISGVPKYNIPERAHAILRDYLQAYGRTPSRMAKHELAAQTGLAYSTVTNWFKNRRQRATARSRSSLRSTIKNEASERAQGEALSSYKEEVVKIKQEEESWPNSSHVSSQASWSCHPTCYDFSNYALPPLYTVGEYFYYNDHLECQSPQQIICGGSRPGSNTFEQQSTAGTPAQYGNHHVPLAPLCSGFCCV